MFYARAEAMTLAIVGFPGMFIFTETITISKQVQHLRFGTQDGQGPAPPMSTAREIIISPARIMPGRRPTIMPELSGRTELGEPLKIFSWQ